MTLYFVLAFQLVCTLAVLLTLRTAGDSKKQKLIYLLMGASTVICAIGAVGVKVCLKENMTALLKRGLVGVELLLFALLVAGALITYTPKRVLSMRITLSKSEKIIGLFALGVGLASVVYMAIQNPLYVMPSDEYGYISNFYFNADIDRGISTAVNFDYSVATHPLYRFALFPINFAILLIRFVLRKLIEDSGYLVSIICGYLLCLVQIVLNSASAILVKRLLKDFGKENSSMGAVIFIVTFSTFWVSILPETYASALFFTLLGLYLNSIRNKFWIATAITAVGVNPFTAVAFIPAFIHLITDNKEYIRAKKKIVFIGAGIAAVALCAVIPFVYKVVIEPGVLKWSDFEFFSTEKIVQAFSTIITEWFVAPSFVVSEPYFVQLKDNGILLIVITALSFILCICGAVFNYKRKIVQSAATMFIVGIFLHVFMGYGRYNGVIYAPLYGWASAVLITSAVAGIVERTKKKDFSYIFHTVAVVFIMCNSLWLFKMGTEIKQIEFKAETEKMPFEVYVGTDGYLLDGTKLIRTTDYKVLAENVDSARLYSDRVSALCNDGTMIVIDEKNQTGSSETTFFIFGMGNREKFIFREDKDGLYDLVKYSDNTVVLNDTERIDIIPEDYFVCTRVDGQEVYIIEDENGIYIHNGEEVIPLDESEKINIPDFSGHKYERELKMLFNEVAVNVTENGISANFMAYENTWYRDAAIMAMVLEKTGNTAMITDWIDSITEVYDMQNGTKEGDNLGQLLYLLSLSDNNNSDMIDKVLNEALSLRESDGALGGTTTDGLEHRAYQTRWLKFGIESLGLDSSEFVIPQNEQDDYADMLWFDGYDKQGCPEKEQKFWNRWPYIYYAKCHLNGEEIDLPSGLAYPISKEYKPSMADFEKMSAANPMLTELELVAPHGWSAAELFLLLYEGE